jgi:anti-sigma regulatory factor (Ser/Thr protein kinase)
LDSEFTIDTHADARAARTRIAAYLREQASSDSDLAATELIVSEIVGNALKHGAGGASLRLEWCDDRAILHVRNSGQAFEAPLGLPEEPSAETGRGLFLVRAISLGLRIERDCDMNHVHVILPVRRGKPAPAPR